MNHLKLMEYQSKALFEQFEIPTMRGAVVDHVEDLDRALGDADIHYPVVIKAQVPIGGRGKAGGIQFAHNLAEAKVHCERLLGSTLRGYPVNRLMVVEESRHNTEWYLAILLDRISKTPSILFSCAGGMEIEETARTHPDKIQKIPISPMIGIQDYMARYLLSSNGLPLDSVEELNQLLKKLYRCFMAYDCMLCEINPLAIDCQGHLVALDGKVDIDDSALYRLPDAQKWRNETPENALVKEARDYNFLYIPVSEGGSIAVCSNGSGMLMSCIDMITKEGMTVGAALDLGGGATKERISEAMRILFSTPGIRAVLINIFGGITRCDEVAGGVRLAMEQHMLGDKIVILRMEGTNKDQAIEIIDSLGANVIRADGLRESVAALLERRDRL